MTDSINPAPPAHSPDKPAPALQEIQRTREKSPGEDNALEQDMISRNRSVRQSRDAEDAKQKRGEGVASKSREDLEEIREAVNEALKDMNIGLDFEEDDEAEEMVVKVMKLDTEEVIRKIPPEAMLRVARRMEEMAGMFVDEFG